MDSRLDNSVRNISYGILSSSVMALLPMITRTVFIYILGKDYLGIDSVFANIISLLEIVNVGIGSAITYSVYKPISEGNIEKCKTLFRLYRNCYYVMGAIIAIAGIAVIPFFDILLKNKPDIPESLIVIYLILLFGTVSGYFFADKQCIFAAHQKNYVVSRYRTIVVFIINIIEIIALLTTKKYLVYLVIQTTQNLAINICVARKAYKVYPYIKERNVAPLEKEERKVIVRNTSALVLNRAGSLLINGTDNIVLSSTVGVTSVGLYSNYFTIKNIINNYASIFTTQITASIGNFKAEINNPKRLYELFKKIFVANYILYSFCSICLVCLFQPFITLWLGSDYLLGMGAVLVVVAVFFFVGTQNTAAQFKAACGLYWQDRYRVIVEGILNLTISILLALKFGLIGVFLGTLISNFLVSFWVEPYIVFKYALQTKLKYYFRDFIKYFLVTLIVGFICIAVPELIISGSGIFAFALRLVIVVVLNAGLHVIIFWKNKDFESLKEIGIGYIKKMIKGRAKHG